jgi:hypothetical protein
VERTFFTKATSFFEGDKFLRRGRVGNELRFDDFALKILRARGKNARKSRGSSEFCIGGS